jgi:polyhydroxyalkanoate synthase
MQTEPWRTWQRLLNFPRLVQTAAETRVGTTPYDVVVAEGTHRLLRYRRETPALYGPPVLLCYALVNRPYILDLQPDKSVVQQYLRRGFDVYLIDWGVPRDDDRWLTLADYVNGFLARSIDHILGVHRCDDLHLLGYCMGGTLAVMSAALRPNPIKTLTLLAAPIDFGGELNKGSLLNLWVGNEQFDVDALIDTYGNCPAWFLQACFLAMNPIGNLLEKNLALFEQLDQADSARVMVNHCALERWVNDNIPVAGETFRQFVKLLYKRNELVSGTFTLGGRRVDLGNIACPLLLLTAINDHLVAPASTEGIRPHVASQDITSMPIAAGHVGLVVSSKAQGRIWPEATSWMADRSDVVVDALAGD